MSKTKAYCFAPDMRIIHFWIMFLLATGTLHSAASVGSTIESRLSKAEKILLSTEVIAPIGVVYSFPPAEANWALSVIVKYDPNPLERLKRIAKNATFEGAFMSLVVVKGLDKQAYEKLADEWTRKIKAQSTPIDIFLPGGVPTLTTADNLLAEIAEWDADAAFLLPEIPPLEETIRRKRLTSEEIARHKALAEEDRRAIEKARAAQKK